MTQRQESCVKVMDGVVQEKTSTIAMTSFTRILQIEMFTRKPAPERALWQCPLQPAQQGQRPQ